MDLREYIFFNRENNLEFAKKCGISKSSLFDYKFKRRRPYLETAKRISAVTGGKVTLEDLRGKKC